MKQKIIKGEIMKHIISIFVLSLLFACDFGTNTDSTENEPTILNQSGDDIIYVDTNEFDSSDVDTDSVTNNVPLTDSQRLEGTWCAIEGGVYSNRKISSAIYNCDYTYIKVMNDTIYKRLKFNYTEVEQKFKLTTDRFIGIEVHHIEAVEHARIEKDSIQAITGFIEYSMDNDSIMNTYDNGKYFAKWCKLGTGGCEESNKVYADSLNEHNGTDEFLKELEK